MTDTRELRRAALDIFNAALRSVDAGAAVRKAVKLEGSRLRLNETSFDLSKRRAGVYVIAIGKAALAMATALDGVLGEHITAGLIVGPRGERSHALSLARTRWRLIRGGHPLPDRASLRAAQASFELLARADAERAPVVFLISGGGSAMIEWPRDERITLGELRAANRVLVSCGAAIAEINSVRRAFSAVKGGGLAERAPRAPQLTLIVSDTGEGDEANVASGPTIAPPAKAADAREVVARYNLTERLPPSVLRAIDEAATSKASRYTRAMREHYVLLDNRSAMEAAAGEARRRGYAVELARDLVEQPIAEGCAEMISRLLGLRRRKSRRGEQRAVCLISGGEFACPVRGRGVGGRNSETALRCAIELNELDAKSSDASRPIPTEIVALSAGTDGTDGNSPAAGALADLTTVARAHKLNLDARRFLDESDAYSFFDALGDTIMVGPTGTNVRDLRVLLAR